LDPLLEAVNISRRYGDFEALKTTHLALFPGELVTLRGPNGAGKSTLLLCLGGLIGLTTGEVKVCGQDLYMNEREARRDLAYVPDVPAFYAELTAWEHLSFMASAHSAAQGFEQRAETLLRELGLWDSRDLYPHAYSRGMRLKLGLALALIRPFRVLLLDEPTSALDAESTSLLGDKLAALRDQGAAILLTTHDTLFSEHLGAKTWTMRNGELLDAEVRGAVL
jgi:ABC-2 type transport system ATP-binding protein